MIRVLETFFDGNSHTLYVAGMEITDDPSLRYAEKRGLTKRIEEDEPKKPVKKTTPKKK